VRIVLSPAKLKMTKHFIRTAYETQKSQRRQEVIASRNASSARDDRIFWDGALAYHDGKLDGYALYIDEKLGQRWRTGWQLEEAHCYGLARQAFNSVFFRIQQDMQRNPK
jgi:hypothetical protein